MEISRRDRNALKRVGSAAAKAYSDSLTPEQRKKRASDAAKARWARVKDAAMAEARGVCDACAMGKKMPSRYHGLDCPKRAKKAKEKR